MPLRGWLQQGRGRSRQRRCRSLPTSGRPAPREHRSGTRRHVLRAPTSSVSPRRRSFRSSMWARRAGRPQKRRPRRSSATCPTGPTGAAAWPPPRWSSEACRRAATTRSSLRSLTSGGSPGGLTLCTCRWITMVSAEEEPASIRLGTLTVWPSLGGCTASRSGSPVAPAAPAELAGACSSRVWTRCSWNTSSGPMAVPLAPISCWGTNGRACPSPTTTRRRALGDPPAARPRRTGRSQARTSFSRPACNCGIVPQRNVRGTRLAACVCASFFCARCRFCSLPAVLNGREFRSGTPFSNISALGCALTSALLLMLTR
mmetsp:Transcript_40239/g.125397  ORF Transcript_40239/g.125397 Transcript_40239/m.125397 type:complete len:316 (+) Transcript_40239:487-1434(+)